MDPPWGGRAPMACVRVEPIQAGGGRDHDARGRGAEHRHLRLHQHRHADGHAQERLSASTAAIARAACRLTRCARPGIAQPASELLPGAERREQGAQLWQRVVLAAELFVLEHRELAPVAPSRLRGRDRREQLGGGPQLAPLGALGAPRAGGPAAGRGAGAAPGRGPAQRTAGPDEQPAARAADRLAGSGIAAERKRAVRAVRPGHSSGATRRPASRHRRRVAVPAADRRA